METVIVEKDREGRPEPEPRPLHLAQLGAGHWGVNLIRNLSQLTAVDRLTVCDLDPGRREFVRERYPTVTITDVAEDLFADPSVDAVIVALPVFLHHEYTKKALLAGKHVFVEKPLARTLAEAQELVELAAAKQRVLLVGHTFLYNDAVRKVKEYIDSGELGEIYYISAQRLNLGRVRNDVNALWNLAPHDISIILYWLGQEPVAWSATGMTFLQEAVEDVVFANLHFPSGIAAHIHVSWLDPLKTRQMVVVGSKKMIVYDDVSTDSKIVIYDKGVDKHGIDRRLPDIENYAQFQLRHRSGDVLIPKLDFKEPLRRECQHFVDCIVNGAEPLTDGAAGLEVVRVLELIQRSLEESRSQIPPTQEPAFAPGAAAKRSGAADGP